MGGSMILPNIMIGAGSVVILLAVFFGFGGYSFVVQHGIPFALQLIPTDQELNVWVEIPIPIHITVSIFDIKKMEGNETKEIGEKVLGGGKMSFKIEMEAWGAMPDLTNATQQKLVPMVWIQEDSQLDEIMRYMLVLASWMLNYWWTISWIIVIGAIGLVAFGVFLMQKRKNNTVVTIKEEE